MESTRTDGSAVVESRGRGTSHEHSRMTCILDEVPFANIQDPDHPWDWIDLKRVTYVGTVAVGCCRSMPGPMVSGPSMRRLRLPKRGAYCRVGVPAVLRP